MLFVVYQESLGPEGDRIGDSYWREWASFKTLAKAKKAARTELKTGYRIDQVETLVLVKLSDKDRQDAFLKDYVKNLVVVDMTGEEDPYPPAPVVH